MKPNERIVQYLLTAWIIPENGYGILLLGAWSATDIITALGIPSADLHSLLERHQCVREIIHDFRLRPAVPQVRLYSSLWILQEGTSDEARMRTFDEVGRGIIRQVEVEYRKTQRLPEKDEQEQHIIRARIIDALNISTSSYRDRLQGAKILSDYTGHMTSLDPLFEIAFATMRNAMGNPLIANPRVVSVGATPSTDLHTTHSTP